jgi:hypothetical protein
MPERTSGNGKGRRGLRARKSPALRLGSRRRGGRGPAVAARYYSRECKPQALALALGRCRIKLLSLIICLNSFFAIFPTEALFVTRSLSFSTAITLCE